MDMTFDSILTGALEAQNDDVRVANNVTRHADNKDSVEHPEVFDKFFAEKFEKATIGHLLHAHRQYDKFDAYAVDTWEVSFVFRLTGVFKHKTSSDPRSDERYCCHTVYPPDGNDGHEIDEHEFGVNEIYIYTQSSDTFVLNPYNFHLYQPGHAASDTPKMACKEYIQQGQDWYHEISDIGRRQRHIRCGIEDGCEQFDKPIDEEVQEKIVHHYIKHVKDIEASEVIISHSSNETANETISFLNAIELYYDISLDNTSVALQLLKSKLDDEVYQQV